MLEKDIIEISVELESSTLELKSKLNNSEIIMTGSVNPIGEYDGSYTITPNQTTQTINTSNKLLKDNIVVSPIPSNYGRIIWNGSTMSIV